MALVAGEVFAGYTIVRQLGGGGMGEVYLGQHPRLPRRDALKVLRTEISSDDSFRQRFIRESDSIAGLEHPHIVTVYDRGDNERRLWIATQYVDGSDAAQLLRDRYPAGMPVDEAVAVTTAIAEALDHAHDRGLIHRDVKPANILLAKPDQDGTRRVYLADFGIARPLDDPAGLTSTNFTLGTFAYAAPEQLMGKAIDGRADQYALAATTYQLLTGTPVFSDSNQIAVISQHLTEIAPAPSTIRPELGPFDAAFARALAKSPQDRYSNCRDFAKALTDAAGSSGGDYPASAPTQQAPIPAIRQVAAIPRRRSPARATLAAAVLLGSSPEDCCYGIHGPSKTRPQRRCLRRPQCRQPPPPMSQRALRLPPHRRLRLHRRLSRRSLKPAHHRDRRDRRRRPRPAAPRPQTRGRPPSPSSEAVACSKVRRRSIRTVFRFIALDFRERMATCGHERWFSSRAETAPARLCKLSSTSSTATPSVSNRLVGHLVHALRPLQPPHTVGMVRGRSV
jgi:serine/threonine protein kinase